MKKLFGASRRRGGAGLLIAMLVLAASAGTALAATLTGGNNNNTIIGTPNVADVITDGNGSDIVYGLGGGDTITVGNGNDVIVADGQCTQGYDTVTPGYSEAAYCEPTQGNPKEGRSTITTGSGSSVIVGGAGPNTINAGVGTKANDVIVGGQVGDKIKSSNGDNVIVLGSGSSYGGSTVNDGSGSSVIFAQNGVKDTITCAPGNHTTVFADSKDSVTGCAHRQNGSGNDPAWQSIIGNASLIRSVHATHKATGAKAGNRSRKHKGSHK